MNRPPQPGFTLIEMVVVMATIALLLALALPSYMDTLERGKEQVLRQNMVLLREALDKHYGDTGRYPGTLEDLVARRYLRAIPVDPYTESPTWVVIAPKDPALGGVIDVQSTLTDRDGQPRKGPAAAMPATGTPAGATPEAPPGLLAREGGLARTVTVQPAPPERPPEAAR